MTETHKEECLKLPIKNSAIIVLAAGASRRLGQAKQLVIHADEDINLLRYQCEQALKVCENVICVLGFKHEKIARSISELPVTVIVNKDWQRGLGSSISCGVKNVLLHSIKENLPGTEITAVNEIKTRCKSNHKINDVMLLLVDQWQIKASDLITIYLKKKNNVKRNLNSIVCAANGKKWGPPVLFPAIFFQKLTQLTGEQGAKVLLKAKENSVLPIEMAHAFVDLDTPEDLVLMQKYFANSNT